MSAHLLFVASVLVSAPVCDSYGPKKWQWSGIRCRIGHMGSPTFSQCKPSHFQEQKLPSTSSVRVPLLVKTCCSERHLKPGLYTPLHYLFNFIQVFRSKLAAFRKRIGMPSRFQLIQTSATVPWPLRALERNLPH